MTREEALNATKAAYDAAEDAYIATYKAAKAACDTAYAVYQTEVDRINKEYPE